MLTGAVPGSPPLEVVSAAYGLKIVSAAPVRAAWLIATDQARYYLKRTAASREDLPFLAALHDYLNGNAPGLTPRLRRPPGGGYGLVHEGRVYLLYEELAGREADYNRRGDLEAVAAGLAWFHRAARGFAPLPPAGPRRCYGRWPAWFARRLRDLQRFRVLGRWRDGAFDRAYQVLMPRYLTQARNAAAWLNASDYSVLSSRAAAAREICHHDLAHHNALLDGPVVRFVDLDYALADLALHDLANLLGHLLRLHAWDLEPVRRALGSYWPRPPAKETLAVLGALLLWPQDFWQIGRQFYDERQPWTEDHFLALLERKCGRPAARERFLADFWRAYGLPGGPF
ncbi:MAG: CotS family spore coat protein [Bacteroidota bacterium]